MKAKVKTLHISNKIYMKKDEVEDHNDLFHFLLIITVMKFYPLLKRMITILLSQVMDTINLSGILL